MVADFSPIRFRDVGVQVAGACPRVFAGTLSAKMPGPCLRMRFASTASPNVSRGRRARWRFVRDRRGILSCALWRERRGKEHAGQAAGRYLHARRGSYHHRRRAGPFYQPDRCAQVGRRDGPPGALVLREPVGRRESLPGQPAVVARFCLQARDAAPRGSDAGADRRRARRDARGWAR